MATRDDEQDLQLRVELLQEIGDLPDIARVALERGLHAGHAPGDVLGCRADDPVRAGERVIDVATKRRDHGRRVRNERLQHADARGRSLLRQRSGGLLVVRVEVT
ncbi:MAG TPA: hypothetical protein VGF94_15245 [Kofleriaceae bacterium]